MVRMHVEYVLGYLTAISRGELDLVERLRCLAVLSGWLGHRLVRGRRAERLDRDGSLLAGRRVDAEQA